jgi:hypothetical protein
MTCDAATQTCCISANGAMCIDAQGTCPGLGVGCVNSSACGAGNVCCLSLVGGASSCVTPAVCNFAGGVVLCSAPVQCPAATPSCCRFGPLGLCSATCR